MDKYSDIIIFILAGMLQDEQPNQTPEKFYLEFDSKIRESLRIDPLEMLKRELELKILKS